MKAGLMVGVVLAAMSLFAAENKVGEAVAALYDGKTAVITGAASGMGLCTSKTLAAAGATVFMCDINAEGVRKAAEEINSLGKGKAYAVVADVRNFADAERSAALAVEKTGKIDLLVNYAGGNEARCCKSFKPFYEQPIEVIDWGLDVNLRGAVYFSRACMPYMVKAKRGVIVCIGSVTGFEGDGNGAMYGTSKSGLFNFVVGLAKAGAPHGIRAFCVSPGPVLTRPAMAKMQTALGFASQPQEIVDYVLYNASECCPSMTGSNLLIDAGRLCVKRGSTAGFLEAGNKK